MLPAEVEVTHFYGKQICIFFLLPTVSSFLITSLSGWGGGDAHGRGGMHRGGTGMHVHPVHPPLVRPCGGTQFRRWDRHSGTLGIL